MMMVIMTVAEARKARINTPLLPPSYYVIYLISSKGATTVTDTDLASAPVNINTHYHPIVQTSVYVACGAV